MSSMKCDRCNHSLRYDEFEQELYCPSCDSYSEYLYDEDEYEDVVDSYEDYKYADYKESDSCFDEDEYR